MAEMDSLTLAAGSSALISSVFLQYLKKAKWFGLMGIEPAKEKINLLISILVAGAVSLGISYKFDSDTGILVISGLTMAGISHQIWHWLLQWTAQHVSYKAFVVPSELLAAIVNQLKDIQK